MSHGGTGFGGVVGCDGLVSLVVALDLLDCWGVFCIFGFFFHLQIWILHVSCGDWVVLDVGFCWFLQICGFLHGHRPIAILLLRELLISMIGLFIYLFRLFGYFFFMFCNGFYLFIYFIYIFDLGFVKTSDGGWVMVGLGFCWWWWWWWWWWWISSGVGLRSWVLWW